MRHAAKVDQNQADIVAAMRAMGAYVWIIGLPVDLLVGHKGRTALVEVKRIVGKRVPRQTAHTALQRDFFEKWPGGTVATVCDVESAIRLIRQLESEAIDDAESTAEAVNLLQRISRGEA